MRATRIVKSSGAIRGVRGAHVRQERGMRERQERRREQRSAYARREARPAKGRLNNGVVALMRDANEIGSGACMRQERGVQQRSAPFRRYSTLGFGLRQENRRAVQHFACSCPLSYLVPSY